MKEDKLHGLGRLASSQPNFDVTLGHQKYSAYAEDYSWVSMSTSMLKLSDLAAPCMSFVIRVKPRPRQASIKSTCPANPTRHHVRPLQAFCWPHRPSRASTLVPLLVSHQRAHLSTRSHRLARLVQPSIPARAFSTMSKDMNIPKEQKVRGWINLMLSPPVAEKSALT